MLEVTASFNSTASQYLDDMRLRAGNHLNLHAIAGHYMRDVDVPERFAFGGPGWAKSDWNDYAPMIDTRRLADSIAYNASDDRVKIGTNVPYARNLNGFNGNTFTVTATNKKYLTIPNPAYFSPAALRSAKASDYPQAFFLDHGPEGRGLYVRDPQLKKLFSCVHSVRIKARQFLSFRPKSLRDITDGMVDYIARGANRDVSRSEGNPDVGSRGGRP